MAAGPMAAAHYDLIIRGGIAVLPWGEEATDIGVRQGRIAAFGVPGSAEAETVLDARGLHVLPGLIDAHVHLREPGADHVETIATGTRAAALGGLVAVFDMPNTKPAITDAERLAWKRDYIQGRAFVDMGLYVGATKSNVAALAGLEVEPGVCGIKVFAGSSTGDLLVEDDASLEAVMRNGFRRIAYHSEDEYRLQARAPMFEEGDPHIRHMEWRDVETAFLGTRRLANGWLVAFLLAAALAALAVVLSSGRTINGAKRWIELGFFNLQPAEIAKFVVVIAAAWHFANVAEKIRSRFHTVLLPLLVGGVLAGAVFATKDLGSVLVMGVVFTGMLMFSGGPWAYFLLICLSVAAVAF